MDRDSIQDLSKMSRLTNNDFSSLLNQADRKLLKDLSQTKRKKSAQSASTAKERHKQRYLQILKSQKQREKALEQREENSQNGGQWRDRAAERRNAAGDYSRIAEEYQLLKDRSEEESKFLGGDEEHTHLVKGLDFRLLEKVRTEIQKKETEKKQTVEEERAAQHAVAQLRQSIATASITTSFVGRKICSELFEQIHPHHTSFQKRLQRIDSVVLRGAHFRGNTKNYYPGRMIYQFDIRSDGDHFFDPVPVIVFQSIDETDLSERGRYSDGAVVAPVHEKILSDLNDALQWNAQNKKGRRQEGGRRPMIFPKDEDLYPIGLTMENDKESKRNETLKESIRSEEDEDIFGGVGGYDPSEVEHKEEREDDNEELKEKQNYFEEVDNEVCCHTKSNALLPDGLADKIETVRKRGGEEAVEARRNMYDYDECYPNLSWNCQGGSEDEDEDNNKKKKRKGVKNLFIEINL